MTTQPAKRDYRIRILVEQKNTRTNRYRKVRSNTAPALTALESVDLNRDLSKIITEHYSDIFAAVVANLDREENAK